MSVDTTRLTTALADRYFLERELGPGRMATVPVARDPKHDRPAGPAFDYDAERG